VNPLLVLHRFGCEEGGAAWREALCDDAWRGDWFAPDLPGHGEAPWDGDCYEPTDLVIAPLRHLREVGWLERPVVLAILQQSVAAELLALGGRAAGIALVEPRRGPSPSAVDNQSTEYSWLRGLADDPEAQAAAPVGRTDPRARHGCTPRFDAGHAERQRSAIPVPVLELGWTSPVEVLVEVRAWWDSQPYGR
jgi:hypothetical protein